METRVDSRKAREAVLAGYRETAERYQALAVVTGHPVARELARLAELRLRLAEIEVSV